MLSVARQLPAGDSGGRGWTRWWQRPPCTFGASSHGHCLLPASRPGAPRSDTPGSAAFPVPFPAVERCPAGGLRLPGLRLSVLGTCGNYAAEPSGFWRFPRTFDPSALPCVCILYKSKQQVKKTFLQKPKAKRKIFGSLSERRGKGPQPPVLTGKRRKKKPCFRGQGQSFKGREKGRNAAPRRPERAFRHPARASGQASRCPARGAGRNADGSQGGNGGKGIPALENRPLRQPPLTVQERQMLDA